MDMPDKIWVCPSGDKTWSIEEDHVTPELQYTRTDLAQSLADALEGLLNESMASDFNEHWDSYKDAKAALANYRKGV